MFSKILIAVLLFCPEVWAVCDITAASGSRTDVGNAVASATYNQTVCVPADVETWNSTLTITKAIRLQGAGAGSTVITGNVGADNYIVVFDPDATSRNNNYTIEFSGFTLDMNDVQGQGGLRVGNANTALPISNVIVHNNTFQNHKFPVGSTGSTDPTAITFGQIDGVDGDVWGVVYSNTFTDCSGVGEFYGGSNGSWDNLTFSYGSASNMYFEDNTVTGNSVFAFGGHGGRYVSRFNTYNFTTDSPNEYSVGFDCHGNQPGGVYACMGIEAYRNTIDIDRSTSLTDLRGGKFMLWENTITSASSFDLQIREEYDDNSTSSPTTNSQSQHVSDSYSWNNRDDGSKVSPSITQDDFEKGVTANSPRLLRYEDGTGFHTLSDSSSGTRTHWLEEGTGPQTSASSPFSGATGVGFGTLARRPTTCTVGVGYFATDQGSWNSNGDDGLFYKCTSSNTWTLYYTPYTYPHPLRGGGSPAPAGSGSAIIRVR